MPTGLSSILMAFNDLSRLYHGLEEENMKNTLLFANDVLKALSVNKKIVFENGRFVAQEVGINPGAAGPSTGEPVGGAHTLTGGYFLRPRDGLFTAIGEDAGTGRILFGGHVRSRKGGAGVGSTGLGGSGVGGAALDGADLGGAGAGGAGVGGAALDGADLGGAGAGGAGVGGADLGDTGLGGGDLGGTDLGGFPSPVGNVGGFGFPSPVRNVGGFPSTVGSVGGSPVESEGEEDSDLAGPLDEFAELNAELVQRRYKIIACKEKEKELIETIFALGHQEWLHVVAVLHMLITSLPQVNRPLQTPVIINQGKKFIKREFGVTLSSFTNDHVCAVFRLLDDFRRNLAEPDAAYGMHITENNDSYFFEEEPDFVKLQKVREELEDLYRQKTELYREMRNVNARIGRQQRSQLEERSGQN